MCYRRVPKCREPVVYSKEEIEELEKQVLKDIERLEKEKREREK
jgi:hypothetical protein